MIEAPRHLIRVGPGRRIKVLRLFVVAGHIYPLRYHAWRGPGCCQRCGCTDRYGCLGRCSWANATKTLCTKCVEGLAR